MSQIEIAQIIEQIKQEIEVDASGKAKASLRATARLAGVSATAILKTLDSVNQEPSKLAQMLLESGFEAVNLLGWKTEGIRYGDRHHFRILRLRCRAVLY